ncbi:MAG: putative lipid II flippase FtsW [Verrucomicrobiae bacterium]|nr:putative lipid II flippase FtsW [Verrucomicrobiae bacterium]
MNHFQSELSPKALRRTAIILCVAVLALLTFGVVMLCSTSSFYAKDRFGDAYFIFKRQVLWLAIGLVVCAITANIDYRKYRKYARPIIGGAVFLLVLVLVVGPVRNGARRWLIFGPFSFQPSEFAKFALVIFLAFWLERMHRTLKGQSTPKIKHPLWGVGLPLVVTSVLAALILKEPDLGSVLLMFVVAVFLMWVAGSNQVWLGSFVGVVAVAGFIVMFAILELGMFDQHYQVRRIIAWWAGTDPQGINFQQAQASLAFGSGGPWGVGLGDSRQKMFYLPEAHTDFIFPIIGEELGLIGTLSVLAGFCVIVVCGILMVAKSPDLFGLLLGSGIVAIIALQAIINIAVVTNSIPNKGMPLPFISYGGSNLVMMLGAIGVLLNIYRQSYALVAGKYLHAEKEENHN